jgi:hypothetical protein
MPEGAVDGGGEPAAPVAAPEPVSPVAPPAQPDFTQQIQEGIGQQLADILGDPEEYEQQYEPQQDFDPEVAAAIDARAKALLDERFGPYEEHLQAIAQERTRAKVIGDYDQLATAHPELGDFDREDALRRGMVLANGGMDYQQALLRSATESAAAKRELISSGQTPVVEAIKTHGAAAVDAYFKANPEGNVSGIPAFIASLQAANGQPQQPGAPVQATPAGEHSWEAPGLSTADRIRMGVEEAVASRQVQLGSG